MPTKKTVAKKGAPKRRKKINIKNINSIEDLDSKNFENWTEEEKGIVTRMIQWRNQNDIKVNEIAAGLGVAQESISHLFMGRYKPNIRLLVLLKQKYGLSYNYLLEGDDSAPSIDVKVKQIIELVLSWENWGQAKVKQKKK